MKALYITTILIATALSSFAQNFSYPLGQNIVEHVEAENYESYEIKIHTASAEAITYQYQLIGNTFNPNWSISLCDYNACYVGVPTSSSMEPITLAEAQGGTHGFFKMNITVGQHYGMGKVSYYVYDASDFSRGDTVSFELIWILAGDADGNGVLDAGEIAGDLDNDGVINGDEVAGDFNGNGTINDGEIAGDINGSGNITTGEIAGDLNGDGFLSALEVNGDANGNGVLDNGEVNAIDEYVFSTLKLYPNPAQNVINIKSEGIVTVTIYDLLGEKMDASFFNDGAKTSCDVSHLKAGLYLFAIQDGDGNVVGKKVTLK